MPTIQKAMAIVGPHEGVAEQTGDTLDRSWILSE